MFDNTAASMKNLGSKTKPTLKITLSDGQQDAFVPTYTSLDEIRGHVSITAPFDMKFDVVYITFEGSTKTYVEKIATASPTNGRSEAYQNFLRLVQPMDDAHLPESGIAEAGKTYLLPFTFVVPERLLPQTCKHQVSHDSIHEAHLDLPPSIGDPMLATVGKTLVDDMAPDMGVVSYAIKCRITDGRASNGRHIIVADTSKKLRIIPASEEQPPLSVLGDQHDDYKLRKEKDIKKGMFKGKLGRLTMESAQPRSLRLPSLGSQSTGPVTTMATVRVRFDPAEETAQPPRLTTLCTKLKTATFFSSVPMRDIPTKSTDFHYSSTKGIFVHTLNLSSRCIASAQWEHHVDDACVRRDSAFSTLPNPYIPEPSSSYTGKSFYTSNILVPITLPKGSKLFTPTFHSCLVSRIYALDLYLSVNSPATAVTASTIHLKLPVQISSEGNTSTRSTSFAQVAETLAATEAENILSPRSVAPPSPEYTERAQLASILLPGPEYTERPPLRSIISASPEYTERPQRASSVVPSPDYTERPQPLQPGPIRRYDTAPPPGYSFSSGRHHCIRMDGRVGMMQVGG